MDKCDIITCSLYDEGEENHCASLPDISNCYTRETDTEKRSLEAELNTWKSTARELVKKNEVLEKALGLSEKHIESTGWYAPEGTIKDHFMEKAREACK